MTKQELRETKDYKEAIEKIKNYKIGFKFTMNYTEIPKAKGNALKIILNDCVKMGILESVSFGLDIEGNVVEEEFKRI